MDDKLKPLIIDARIAAHAGDAAKFDAAVQAALDIKAAEAIRAIAEKKPDAT